MGHDYCASPTNYFKYPRRATRYRDLKATAIFRSLYARFFPRSDHTFLSYSLPATPIVEHRELSPARRHIYNQIDIWQEPDSKPVFSFTLRPRFIQEGIGCKLICCINGKPTPKVQWFKERTQLSDTDPHYLTTYVHGVCTLEITACETSDSAMYRCSATNPLGTDETCCLVHVDEIRRIRRAHSTRPVDDEEIVQYASRSRQTHSSRQVDDETVVKYESRTYSSSSSRVSGRDSSWRDKLGAGEKPAQRDILDVEKPKRKERRDPPKFIEQLIDIGVFEGSTAKLSGEVKGRPTPKVEWLKNGESLTVDSRIEQTYEDDVATLIIKSVKLDDGGEYICRATNDEGSDTSSAQVTIRAHVRTADEEVDTTSTAQEDQTSVPAESQAASVETAAAVPELASSAPVPEPVALVAESVPVAAVVEEPVSVVAEPVPAPVPEPAPATGKAAATKKAAVPEKKAAVPEKKLVGAAALKKPEPAKKVEEKKEAAKKPEEKKEPAKKAADDKTKKSAVEEKKKTEEAVPKPAPVVEAAPVETPKPAPAVEEAVAEPVVAAPAPVVEEAVAEPVVAAPAPVVEEAVPEPVVAAPAPVVEEAVPEPVVDAPAPVEEPAPVEVKEEKEEVEEKPAEPKLKFSRYVKSQNMLEGDSLTLECSCEGVADDIDVVWLRNNKEIPDNPDFRRERVANAFKLVVAEVFPEDSGVFSALLKSKSTSDQLLSSCSVIIQARDEEPLDPNFVQFPHGLSLEEGGKAKFSCKLSGSTPMNAEWNFNGNPLDQNSSRFAFTNGEKEFSFEIPVVLATDQGQYHVTASNDKGEITAAFSLHVEQV
ncbi:unnamed protein product [Rotaria socialis]|uniref:Ig-like domain-containing protein n=1 Tax=Rotaria socialis TaxID=392032 RepID=A0A819CRJ9_9BILA|nr:unnamed protein product [Rotaria socialis]CAF3526267.1 unnamed protein product [Rotaria socialis]CAF3812128.1 unnamed protein product [Rotaria socialis]